MLVFYPGIFVMYLAPALMGMFWGAPLVAREFEAGTFRLAWNQSVSRTRWLVVKRGRRAGRHADDPGPLPPLA